MPWLQLILQALSAAPLVVTDVEKALSDWHNAHGLSERTAAVADNVDVFAKAAASFVQTLKPPAPVVAEAPVG